MRKRSEVHDVQEIDPDNVQDIAQAMQLAEGEETARRADLERHSRKCTICRHPDRDAIEHDFLHWCHPVDIAEEFGLADHSSIYRHAPPDYLHVAASQFASRSSLSSNMCTR